MKTKRLSKRLVLETAKRMHSDCLPIVTRELKKRGMIKDGDGTFESMSEWHQFSYLMAARWHLKNK